MKTQLDDDNYQDPPLRNRSVSSLGDIFPIVLIAAGLLVLIMALLVVGGVAALTWWLSGLLLGG